MKYTTYFREQFKNQGIPDLDNRQAVNLIEIIQAESYLTGLLENDNVIKGYDIKIYTARKQLKDLTKSRTPEQIVSRWRKESS